MPDPNPITYLCVKTATAPKLGRAGGCITYKVLSDPERLQLLLTIVGNDGGGYYSREVVTFANVESCLPADPEQAFPSKVFAPAFVGKSSNNAGFMGALLRAEGLLTGVEEYGSQHRLSGDWPAWKAAMLASPGEPYVPPIKEPVINRAAEVQAPVEPPPAEAVPAPKGRKRRVVEAGEGDDHAHSA